MVDVAKVKSKASAAPAVKAKAKAKASPEPEALVPPASDSDIDLFTSELVDALSDDEGTAQLLGSDGAAIKIRGVLSTQCATLDKAIGRGGVPLARLTIINGPEGCGKTTICLHLVAECQRRGGVVVYIDKEYKLDPDYAASIGVDIKRLIISQPAYLEKTFELSEKIIAKAKAHRERTGVRVPILIVLDSMNAAISKAEFEADWDDQNVASQARTYSRLLPKLIPQVSEEDVALVWISQIRDKIGVMFGNKTNIGGGNAPKFYASLIMDVKKIGTVKSGEEAVANKIRVKCAKNQIAPPFKEAEFEIIYGVGIDREGCLLDVGADMGIVEKSGNWYSFEGKRIGNGKAKAREFLKKNTAMRDRLEAQVQAV